MTNIRFTNTHNNISFDIACFELKALCSAPFELAMVSADGEVSIIQQSDNLTNLICLANSLNDIIKNLSDEEALPVVETLQVLYGI